ncbi:MAG: anthranilate synthase component I family protein [Planctomycetes bacterium]|nr:anthranilate synthase component I family protein [Planctomycetota bacterium]
MKSGARLGGTILESVAQSGHWGRYSIFAADPVVTFGSEDKPETACPFQQLESQLRPWCDWAEPCELPFVGGWIGYISYEASRFIEPMAIHAPRASTLPLMQWSLFDTVLIHDAMSDRWFVAGVELPADMCDAERAPLEDRLDQLADCTEFLDPNDSSTFDAGSPACHTIGWNFARGEYLAKVEQALGYIRAGDIFQVNLARRFHAEIDAHPFSLYERLCRSNASTHAAFMPIHGCHYRGIGPAAVISSSPELFLSLSGRDVVTRPIKGTRPRGSTPADDRRAAAELASSSKDRAELNMIIDLERNDLGRVCEFGSVRVESDGAIETLPTVFHRTATVTGRLREELDAIDLLRATFPGGSITGAPKVRAMQIIQELEPEARGPYCGAIGFIGLDGSMQLNLPIRTMTMQGSRVGLHVGSGIVADSNPPDEYNELTAKVAGMMRAIGVETRDGVLAST